MTRILAFCLLLSFIFCGATPAHATDVYFDDSNPSLIILGNASYEFGLRKVNGSIQYIEDKSTGKIISPGSRYECLWGGVFLVNNTEEFTGGCNYSASGSNHFSYSYAQSLSRLTLSYTASPQAPRSIDAIVLIQANSDNSLDMHLQLTNSSADTMERALFPCDLVFLKGEIQEALLPVMPGMVLKPAFFEQESGYKVKYPGYPGTFASFTAIKTSQGQFAIYDLYEPDHLRETWLGFQNDEAIPPYIANSTTLSHEFAARAAGGQNWSSPWVRLRIGISFVQAINDYRMDNGLNNFASLRQKLGPRFDQVVQSPLYKIDAVQENLPFSQYASDVLAHIPIPGILHPVAFQVNGHDQSYPDFLPPDPRWGTTADFASMVHTAQLNGFLVMPYTNPTWWDDESPTLTHLPSGTTLQDIAVINPDGSLHYETYGPNGGYAVSPRAPFVTSRISQLVQDMTTTIPSDMLFEDQIGARPWLYDYNKTSIDSPLDYIDGWIDHTRLYQGKLLNTELGFDRLAETEVGFHGSVRLPQVDNPTTWWGSDLWYPYPLAAMMVGDKTLFYQHDLAPETFTTSKQALSWNLAYGYQLSYDLIPGSYGGGLNSEWLRLVGIFQKYALSQYSGELVTDFQTMAPNVTRTVFEACAVTYNSSPSLPYTLTGYTLPPQGSMVQSSDGSLTAGIFTTFDGQALSAGDHYLVVHRSVTQATIWQPIGADTLLNLNWNPGTTPTAFAYSLQGGLIGQVPLTVSSHSVQFTYTSSMNNQAVGFIRVFSSNNKWYIPAVRK